MSCTNSRPAPHAGPQKGLFTSTNPELRRVIPDDVAGRVKVKVVYTVLEAQYQSALSAAVKEINKTNKTVRGVVGLQGWMAWWYRREPVGSCRIPAGF